MQFLPGSCRVDTAVWMHHFDANKTAGEEARQQLHKNVVSNLLNKSWRQHPTKHQLYIYIYIYIYIYVCVFPDFFRY